MKILLLVFLIAGIVLFYSQGGADYLSFSYLKLNLQELHSQYESEPFKIFALFTAIYLLLTTLNIPGSLVLTILAGAIFGELSGVVIVTTAGTIGASLSFLVSRYLFKDYLNLKFDRQFKLINQHLRREGIIYIFAIRFMPMSPFVVVNAVLALTNIKLRTFFWTTYIGMLPGNIIYVYAGKRINEIDSPSEIVTPTFLISLVILSLLPLLAKRLVHIRKFAP